MSRLFPCHPDLALPWHAVRLARGSAFFAGCLEVAGGSHIHLNGQANESLAAALGRHQG